MGGESANGRDDYETKMTINYGHKLMTIIDRC